MRRDSVMMLETLITVSPEFMYSLPTAEKKYYFTMFLVFIAERVGKQNILSTVVHINEKTPHMNLCFVPITPEGKLSAKAILGNQKSLSEWQTAYHERMSARWNELERGQSSMVTKRKHIPTWLFKAATRLDMSAPPTPVTRRNVPTTAFSVRIYTMRCLPIFSTTPELLTPYKTDTEIPAYLPLPRFLVSLDLSNDAKILYALLFDRAGISKENGYIEPDGTIRLYFTLEEAKKKLSRSRQVATRTFQELERCGLIVRRKQGLGRPAVITLNIMAQAKGGQAE